MAQMTVETEVNGDAGSYERGPSLVGSLGLSCLYNRFLSCLGCPSKPSSKYFFLTVHYLNSLSPLHSKLGLLSLAVCLWYESRHTQMAGDETYSQLTPLSGVAVQAYHAVYIGWSWTVSIICFLAGRYG